MSLMQYKKNELVDLADKLGLATTGVKSDLEARITEYVDQHGGWEAVASSGKLKDPSWLKLLDIQIEKVASPIKKASGRAAHQVAHQAAVVKGKVARGANKGEDWFTHHSPLQFIQDAIADHSVKQIFNDLRSKFTSADTVVLLFIYLEFALLVWSQVGWSVKPVVSFTVPQALQGLMHHNYATINVRLPLLSGLINRKQFLYPAFYWFIYFVAIPTIAGWLINLSSRAGKVICPINMLTFSWVRLVVFWWCIVGAVNVDSLLSGVPVTMAHSSLTVLFDGAHLPLKLFLGTCASGLVYALYEKHDE